MASKKEKVYVWGSNTFGELGLGNTESKDYAFECSNLTHLGLEQFCCGNNFAIGISDGDRCHL
jgi:alpha-tubulin suppressor-like RCC1 family protein